MSKSHQNNQERAELLERARSALGLDDGRWREIVSGRFDGRTNCARPFENFLRWLGTGAVCVTE